MVDKGAIDRLQHVASTPFKRLTYTEAIEILEGVVRDKKKKFEFPVSGNVGVCSCDATCNRPLGVNCRQLIAGVLCTCV